MMRTIKSMNGFTMGASDGEIGTVKDFYFDDKTWTIRYLVVETGSWLSNRKVLVSPQAIVECDWENKTFPVNLTKEQIKNSPDIDTDQPVSRQHEKELYAHYPWTNYWGGGLWAGNMGTAGIINLNTAVPAAEVKNNNEQVGDEGEDPHLRSAKHVLGYNIRALEEAIGDVEDYLVDDSNWTIHYMVVDTGNWFPGKRVIISPDWIKEINWDMSEVTVNASADQVKNSPEYDPSKHLSTEEESVLKNYYGRFIVP